MPGCLQVADDIFFFGGGWGGLQLFPVLCAEHLQNLDIFAHETK